MAARDLYLPPGINDAGSLPAIEVSLLRAEVDLALDRAESARSTAAQVYRVVTASAQRRYLKRIEVRAALDEGRALQRLGQHALAVKRLQDAVDRATEVYDRATSPVLADTLVALADALIDLHRIPLCVDLIECLIDGPSH